MGMVGMKSQSVTKLVRPYCHEKELSPLVIVGCVGDCFSLTAMLAIQQQGLSVTEFTIEDVGSHSLRCHGGTV